MQETKTKNQNQCLQKVKLFNRTAVFAPGDGQKTSYNCPLIGGSIYIPIHPQHKGEVLTFTSTMFFFSLYLFVFYEQQKP